MQRKIAYEILCSSLIKGEYANIAMKSALKVLPPIKRGFVTDLVNGVLRNYYLLVYQYDGRYKNIAKEDEIILAMAAYEKYFHHEQVYVIGNEYVNLASKSKKGFINALIRHLDAKINYPDPSSDEGLAISYSLPLYLFKMLKAQYELDDFRFYVKDALREPTLFYRLNPKKASFDDLKDLDIEILDHNIFIANKNLLNTPEFKQGLFYVQDYNSAYIVDYLDLHKGETLLDVCSAPGSKLFNALETLNPSDVYANDLHAHRVKLIENRALSLGYEGINYLNFDAVSYKEELACKFDKVLLDVPCSGFGVLKRKPDLRFHLLPEDIDDIVKLQAELLRVCSSYVKDGGILVYSTCTLNTKENSRQVKAFLKNNDDFELIEENMLRKRDDSDRFYVAKLRKRVK